MKHRKKEIGKPTSSNLRYYAAIGLLLVIVTAASYWQVLDAGFIDQCDDEQYVTGNRMVQMGLTSESIKWAFTQYHASNWHPLTWISHMLDILLFGLERPGTHHLTNLVIHIANTLLLFLVLSIMTGAVWRSAFVSALFAVHPLHVESVAWVAERKDVLSTFFMMLTLLAYVRYVRRPGIGSYAIMAVCYALGLMSKPMLVTLPFVLFLLDWWPLGRLREKAAMARLAVEKIPLFVLAITSSMITFLVQDSGAATTLTHSLSLSYRTANALMSYMGYIRKMFWPSDLAMFYPHPERNISIGPAIAAGVIIIALTVLFLRTSKKRPYLGVGWLWYLGTLVPVIGIIQVGGQAMADRYTYIPLIGLFIIIAWTIPEIPRRRSLLAVPAVIVIAALAVLTWRQSGHWHSNITIFEHSTKVVPGNYFCYNNLGNAKLDAGDIDGAIQSYEAALKIRPNDASYRSNLGNALVEKGDPAAALEHCRKAVELNDRDANAHNNLGRAIGALGRLDEALQHFNRAVELNPDHADAHYNIGVAYINQQRYTEAIEKYRDALAIDPKLPGAYNNLAATLFIIGDYEAAWQTIREAARYGCDVNPEIIDMIRQRAPEPAAGD